MARPSKYKTHVEPRLKEIAAWARDGATEEEIAKRLRISVSSLFEYKKEFSEFSEAITRAHSYACVYTDNVEDSLYKQTQGGVVKLKKPIKRRVRFYENGKLVREEEVIDTAEEEIYVTPDTKAQIYWLNNRRPSDWKMNPVDHSGEASAKEALDAIVNAINGASKE